jgi:sterol desaturase/sphingolipid hydroxylase (fatty acid hydroxylase superfamily)
MALGPVILAHEPAIRLATFLGVFAIFGIAESVRPRRGRSFGRRLRWTNNLAIIVCDSLVLRIVFPTAAVGMALLAEQRGWGLMNLAGMPDWAAIPVALLALDLAIYAQHVAFHAVPALWRVHRMHHADLDIDVTTGIRFHPIEMALSMALKLLVVATLGAPAVGVLVFEVLLNATSLFNHANLRLAPGLDRALRRVVVTPDMHRVHHSTLAAEHNSNFGFNLSCWDRMFGTYRAAPLAGHEAMLVGLSSFRSPRELMLDRMLLQPFRSAVTTEGRRTPAP